MAFLNIHGISAGRQSHLGFSAPSSDASWPRLGLRSYPESSCFSRSLLNSIGQHEDKWVHCGGRAEDSKMRTKSRLAYVRKLTKKNRQC
jgi:hypothetical protein